MRSEVYEQVPYAWLLFAAFSLYCFNLADRRLERAANPWILRQSGTSFIAPLGPCLSTLAFALRVDTRRVANNGRAPLV